MFRGGVPLKLSDTPCVLKCKRTLRNANVITILISYTKKYKKLRLVGLLLIPAKSEFMNLIDLAAIIPYYVDIGFNLGFPSPRECDVVRSRLTFKSIFIANGLSLGTVRYISDVRFWFKHISLYDRTSLEPKSRRLLVSNIPIFLQLG